MINKTATFYFKVVEERAQGQKCCGWSCQRAMEEESDDDTILSPFPVEEACSECGGKGVFLPSCCCSFNLGVMSPTTPPTISFLRQFPNFKTSILFYDGGGIGDMGERGDRTFWVCLFFILLLLLRLVDQ